MLKYLLPLEPEHKVYAELFAGGASYFFAKQPSKVEILGDVNGNVANFYKVLKYGFEELLQLIEGTLHCEYTYEEATRIYFNPVESSAIERAHAFWVCHNMGYAGNPGDSFQYKWHSNDNWHPGISTRIRREQFKYYSKRLSTVQVHHASALDLIERLDSPYTFFFLDPPYVGANLFHYKGYTKDDYEALLIKLEGLEGKFLMTSYESDLLEKFTKRNDWHQERICRKLQIDPKSKDKIEVITANYSISSIQSLTKTQDLFSITK